MITVKMTKAEYEAYLLYLKSIDMAHFENPVDLNLYA